MSYRLLNLLRQYSDNRVLKDLRRFHMKTSSTYVKGSEEHPPATLNCMDINKKYLKLLEFSDIRFSLENDPNAVVLCRNIKLKKEREPSADSIATANIDLRKLCILLGDSFGAYHDGRRPYPSGGAIYPVGFIVCVIKEVASADSNTSIIPGIYQYRPSLNRLEKIKDINARSFRSCILGGHEEKSYEPTIAIIYINHQEKNAVKYRYKSYRLSLMEVGSAYQSAIETANLLGVKQRLLASFCDFELSKEIGLDVRLAQPCMVQIF